MKNSIKTTCAFLTIAFLLTACGGKPAATTNSSNTAKPANTATNSTPASNSASNANKPADDKGKTEVKTEKRPEGAAKTASSKENPVPKDWGYIYNQSKGYGFYVPVGTTYESDSKDGLDFWAGTTPAPSNVDMFVLAYKDKTLTKEDLYKDAVQFLESLGSKVTPGPLKEISKDYSLADADAVHPTRGKGKLRILVGTDVTDNYILIIGDDADKFAANEKIINELWGNFEMWSGGASNK